MPTPPSPSPTLSPPERVADSYKRLAESATALGAVSDEFSKVIRRLDAALQKLNLGIITWVRVHGSDNQYTFWSIDVGYTKVGNRWGIAIRERSGDHQAEECDSEEWLFDGAPRHMRIDAIDKIPDLLDKLIKAADKTTKKIQDKMTEAQQLALAVDQAVKELAPQRKGRRS